MDVKVFNESVIGCDLYNGTVTGDTACTLTASTGACANRAGPTVLILNDQGGSVMDVSEDVTATLRAQEHGHPPVICTVAAFMGGQGAKARSIAYCDDGTTPTLRATPSGSNMVPDVCYAIDQQGGESYCRYDENVMITLCSHWTPHALCYAIEGNSVDRASGKNGRGWCEDVSPMLNTQDRHAVCYGISRSMLTGGLNAGGMPVAENLQPTITANGCGAVCYDARGNGVGGDGTITPTMTGDHNGHISDYTTLVVIKR